MKTLILSAAAVTLAPVSSLFLHPFGIGFAESIAIGTSIALIAATVQAYAPRQRTRLAERLVQNTMPAAAPAADAAPAIERMPTGVKRNASNRKLADAA